MYFTIRNFEYFGNDENKMNSELKAVLDLGHTVKLFMTRSTGLTDDLKTVYFFCNDNNIDVKIDFVKDNYAEWKTILILSKIIEEE